MAPPPRSRSTSLGRSPVIVNVSIVVVRSGTARARTLAFRNPIATHVSAIPCRSRNLIWKCCLALKSSRRSWHPGFTPPVTAVPDVFRDYPVRPLSERIPVEGILEAADIGAAANSLEVEPKSWEKWALVSRR